ncbi:MAG: hypothetical protein A3C97_00425 [Candidatus Levybacteria bacterium RIFCSPHIGHO2_02_FULL_37_11]|nr:MAG: hypothetical protein A3C97_00425 [Candidatus Levybacteria bacterium RIFCSPHIGHO2_02_FULL_37_11]
MKKIKQNSDIITRGILREELEITRKDLRIELDVSLEKVVRDVDEKNREYRDQVLTGLDGVMKELETMREENAAGTSLIRRLTDRVDDHEIRITKLESPDQ